VLPAVGPFISSLISSGVSKYSGFRLVDTVGVYDASGRVNNVPGSKEDIFKSKEISLIEKRRLMRFLTFAAGDFEGKPELEGKHDMPFVEFLTTVFTLSEQIASVLTYALAFCTSSHGTA
jgi:RAB protein geranylgeranyltransferase component A